MIDAQGSRTPIGERTYPGETRFGYVSLELPPTPSKLDRLAKKEGGLKRRLAGIARKLLEKPPPLTAEQHAKHYPKDYR